MTAESSAGPMKYLLTQRLGRGRSSVVYGAIAEDPRGWSRKVAVKVFTGEIPNSEARTRFFAAAAKVLPLGHRAIVRTLDFGATRTELYLVTERLVDVVDLSTLLRATTSRACSLPLEVVLYVGAEVASALSEAHRVVSREAAVHRWIRPSSIFLSASGKVYLADFAVADAQTWGPGSLSRRADFVSPEEVSGARLDGRADVFALGRVLHYLLSGHSAASHVGRELDDLTFNPSVPADVATVLGRALEMTPERRFDSTEDLATQLRILFARRSRGDGTRELQDCIEHLRPEMPVATALPRPLLLTSTGEHRGTVEHQRVD